jgi:hypothetical protein
VHSNTLAISNPSGVSTASKARFLSLPKPLVLQLAAGVPEMAALAQRLHINNYVQVPSALRARAAGAGLLLRVAPPAPAGRSPRSAQHTRRVRLVRGEGHGMSD